MDIWKTHSLASLLLLTKDNGIRTFAKPILRKTHVRRITFYFNISVDFSPFSIVTRTSLYSLFGSRLIIGVVKFVPSTDPKPPTTEWLSWSKSDFANDRFTIEPGLIFVNSNRLPLILTRTVSNILSDRFSMRHRPELDLSPAHIVNKERQKMYTAMLDTIWL